MKFSLAPTLSVIALLGLAACGDAEEEPAPAETPEVELPEADVEVVDTRTNESLDVEGLEATVADNTTTVTAELEDDNTATAEGTN